MRPSWLPIALVALAASGCASDASKVPDSPSVGNADGRGTSHAVASGPVLPRPEGPVPIRTPAQVMRVWIAPWEDSRGDLHAPGYLYTEIEPRRWTLGTRAFDDASHRITPLQIEPRKDRKGVKPARRPGAKSARPSAPPPPGKPKGRELRKS